MRCGLLSFLLVLAWSAPAAAQTIIIDDSDGPPTFTLTGNDWTTWGMLGYGYDGGDVDYHYLSHTVGGSDRVGTATWTPDIPTAGTWQISTWFRMTENRTDDADHFIYDGLGGSTHISLDQQGEGASGWVDLGQHWCAQGVGGCYVVLDGTDDNQSDEANAVQFVLITPEDPPEPEPVPGCDEFAGVGPHSQESYAGGTSAVDWESPGLATGAPDGQEAHTPNVDAGEYLHANGWTLCDPIGEETIDAVTIEVLARTQYASGVYALDLLLHGGGAAQSVFTGTSLSWHGVDVTGDLGSWTWADANALTGQLQLSSHPGGERDSDAWVDAWRVVVDYTTTAGPDDGGDDDDAADDDDVAPDDDDVADDDDDEPVEDDDDVAEDDDDVTDDDDAVDDDDVADADDASDLATGDGGGAPGGAIGACSCDQDLGADAVALLPLLFLPALRRRS